MKASATVKISKRWGPGLPAPTLGDFENACKASLPTNTDWVLMQSSAMSDPNGRVLEAEFREVIHMDSPVTERLRSKLTFIKALASVALQANSGVRDDVRAILTQIKDTEL